MALFRSFWHGKPLSPYQELCLTSFVDHGHEFILYSYDHVDVPAGVALRDAAEFFPRDRVFYYSNGPGAGSVSAFSNLFRYRLLHDNGGWWTDADVICLSRNVPDDDIVFAWQDRSRALIGSAILKLPRGHQLAAELYKAAQEMGADVEWGQAGPDLVTRLVKRHALEHQAMDPSLIYPLAPTKAIQSLMPAHRDAIREKTSGAVFLHLWNEMLRRSLVFDAVAPPHGSFLGDLFEKHGVKFADNLVYSADQVRRLEDNYVGNLQSATAEAQAASYRLEIARLKGEVDQALIDMRSAIAERDVYRTLWRLSWPLHSVARLFRKADNRPG